MSKRPNTVDKFQGYKKEEFDPSSVYSDPQTNLLKVPSSWTRSGNRIINEEEKKLYAEYLKRNEHQRSPKYASKQSVAISSTKQGGENKYKAEVYNTDYGLVPNTSFKNSKGLIKSGVNENKPLYNQVSNRKNNHFYGVQKQVTPQLTIFMKKKLQEKQVKQEFQRNDWPIKQEEKQLASGKDLIFIGQNNVNENIVCNQVKNQSSLKDFQELNRIREAQKKKTHKLNDQSNHYQKTEQKKNTQIGEINNKMSKKEEKPSIRQQFMNENANANLLLEIANLKKRLQLATIFTSPILRDTNHSAFIQSAIEQTLGKKLLKADLLYQKGKHCQNLEIQFEDENFPFFILIRSKMESIFGIICNGLGKKSHQQNVALLNVSSKRIYRKLKGCDDMSGAKFVNSYLVFGNNEVVIKNRKLSQIQVNCGNSYGKVYFDIGSRYEFTGESQQKIQLANLQLHRLHLS